MIASCIKCAKEIVPGADNATFIELTVDGLRCGDCTSELAEAEVNARSAEYRRALRHLDLDLHTNEDESDDPRVLRDCLIRTRLGAACERQSAATRSIVADVFAETRKDEKIVWRFVVSVPTGDLGEVREASKAFIAAWVVATGVGLEKVKETAR